MPLYCFVCKKYFHCGEKHMMGNSTYISVDVCTICEKSWCYFFNKRKKESPDVVFGEFNKEDEKHSPIDKYTLPPLLSPITTQCDQDKSLKLHSILPALLKLDLVVKIQPDEWKRILVKKFIHLHLKNHNIFHPIK